MFLYKGYCLLLLVGFCGFSCAVRVKDFIYLKLTDADKGCFRLLNGTQQIGCQSGQYGSVGIVHMLKNEIDTAYFIKEVNGNAPYIVAMRWNLFKNVSLLSTLHSSGKVNGVLLLLDSDSRPNSYSEDNSCPNDKSGLYNNDSKYGDCKQTNWNEIGSGMRYLSWDIPMIFIENQTEIDYIENRCYAKLNQPSIGKYLPSSLCAIEILTFNLAAGSTETCMRRNTLFSGLDPGSKICDEIGDYNLFAFVPETEKSLPINPKSVVVVAARMDSFGFFSNSDPGSASSISNVIAMLLMADAIGRNMQIFQSLQTHRHMMFVLFNGEALDYIGSSRMVWDMNNDRFPLALDDKVINQSALFNLTHIDFFVELNQLVPSDTTNPKYYVHVDPVSIQNKETEKDVKDFVAKLKSKSSGFINAPDYELALPPASLQTFLKSDRNLSGIVITNHKKAFSNKFYNSFLDNPMQLDVNKSVDSIVQLTNSLLPVIVNRTFRDSTLFSKLNLTINQELATTLAQCLWGWPNWNCSVLNRIDGMFNEKSYLHYSFTSTTARRTYVGINTSPVRTVTSYIMSYLLANDKIVWTNGTVDTCKSSSFGITEDQIRSYTYMPDLFSNSSESMLCVITPVKLSVARSPAFVIPGYDFSSGQYPTWSESIWTTPTLRMFMKVNPRWEGTIFGFGLTVFILSILFGYVLKKGSDTLFASNVVSL